MNRLHHEAEAAVLPYGAPTDPAGVIEVVESFGELELEYAALRKHCVLLDMPHRAVLEVTGADRIEFLNRMLTQQLKDLAPFRVARSFLLNTKGRIDADLRIIHLPERTLLEVDVHAAERAGAELSKYIITEDVVITDVSEATHRLSLHGPTAQEFLAAVARQSTTASGPRPAFQPLGVDEACTTQLWDSETVVFRDDQCAEIGLELIIDASNALHIYQQLIDSGRDVSEEEVPQAVSEPSAMRAELRKRIKLRPAGWHAFNIGRVEAGSPLFNIDFGSQSLPAETGLLDRRVSFTKGCYLGQEIVARMHARGHPKQCLVAIKFENTTDESTGLAYQPVTGAALCPTGASQIVGQITSSVLAPMLSSTPVAFAQVRFANCDPASILIAPANGRELKGVIQPQLAFYPPSSIQAGLRA
jgi:folate-binding protein YgfZ